MFFGFITVRLSSSRLKEKAILNFGKFTVLGHAIERLKLNSIIPIVCTTENSKDDVIVKISSDHNCKYFRGSEKNKIKRWLDCANNYGIEYFHTVECDDPFFCGDMIKESITLLKNESLDFIYPNKRSFRGLGELGYSINTNFLEKLVCINDYHKDTEMVEIYFDQSKSTKSKQYKSRYKDIGKYRLTLDYEEDYWLLKSIINILGQNPSRDEIEKLFKNNPDLHKINYFRNADWEEKQNIQTKNQLKDIN
tara:strand:- start:54846 stop:55598 length:753 start_codon:yes stop_codon:yes gene_type:complete